MDLCDQLGEPLVVACAVAAPLLCANPGTVVGSISYQNSAQQPDAEPVAVRVDKRETLARWRVVDQRLGCLAKDLVHPTLVSNLAPTSAQFPTQFGDNSGKIMTA